MAPELAEDDSDEYCQDDFDRVDEVQDAPLTALMPTPVLTGLPLMLSSVPLLESLDHTDLEHVASMLRPEYFGKGAEVITQAEFGDKLYFVEDGAAVAEIDGTVVMRYGRGDFFGELALVTQEARKATVRAVGSTSLRCLSLTQDAFDLPEFSNAMIWEKIFTNSPASRYKQTAGAAPALVAPAAVNNDHALSPLTRIATRTTSATSDSFAQQMEAAGLVTPADATLSDSSSDAEGQARLYQTTKRATLRETADLHSARVGTLLSGEVISAQPASDGGLRIHCHGRGWASVAADDGTPLLLPLSRQLQTSIPVFGRYYSATVRVPIRDSPAVSSSSLGADAAILPGECVRIDRIVFNELAIPKIAILHEAEYEADANAGAEAVSSIVTWGWVSFWSISDASALFAIEDETPSPTRVWGIGGTSSGTGTGLQPPSCRPPPPPLVDGSGGPTSVDADGQIIFGYHEPRTVTRAALAMQAVGKSATKEQMKLKMAIDASAENLQLSPSVNYNESDSTKLDSTELVASHGNPSREHSFLANPSRHVHLVDELERPCTVSFVRGHVSMDDLSYIRQTFAKPSVLLATFGCRDGNDGSEKNDHNSIAVDRGESSSFSSAIAGFTPDTEGGVVESEDSRVGGSGYSMSSSTLHSPSSWVHISGVARHDENWGNLGDSRQNGVDTSGYAASTEQSKHEVEQETARGYARLSVPLPPPPPKRSARALPGRPGLSPPSSSTWGWSMYEFDPAVEEFLEPLEQRLPGLRKACQIARIDDTKLAELEGLRRHWCLEEGDSDTQDAASHPFLRWLHRLGVVGIDQTLAVCAALRHMYQERWDWQAVENGAAG